MLRLSLGWVARAIRVNRIATALILAIAVSLVTTFMIVTNRETGVAAEAHTVLWLLILNLALFGALALAFLYRLIDVWIRRRRGVAGSRLYMRLIVFFSVLVAVPSILVASFAAIFFYFGVQDWFNDRVRTSVEESLNVAEAYLEEHQQVIRADALAMANDLNREAPALMGNTRRLAQALQTQTLVRNLTEAVIFDSTGRVIAKSGLTFAMEFETVPDDALAQARAGEAPVVTRNTDDRVRALVRLNQFVDAYLYVGRFVDPAVLGHMDAARDAVEGYAALEERRGNLIAVMTLIFIGAALLLLLVAIGLALKFASWLAVPVGQLIQASDRVSGGDFGVRVAEPAHMDELSILSRTFNRMTSQLEEQRDELVEANRKMDRRRRFTETVLSGVSAGIISINGEGQVRLANRRATEFLTGDAQQAVSGNIFEQLPGLSSLTDRVRQLPQRDVEEELSVPRPLGQPGDRATLLVRITAELQESQITGFIITFDDITDLVAAQRTAAWADVARRIAHEIKNPLTPIQLAAERLRRRYGELVPANDGTFDTCIDTIIRQVGDIGGMVDEFSSFARMPQPQMAQSDLVELTKQVMFLQRQASPEIRIELGETPTRLETVCDRRQIAQALTNILKNAVESVEQAAARVADSADDEKYGGEIIISIHEDSDDCQITVRDNGIGFPDLGRDRLTEPYVTRRAGGTGLGLAIVKKIMEDHGGSIRLEDNTTCGAYVTLVLSKSLTVSAGDAADGDGQGGPLLSAGSRRLGQET